MIPVQLTWQGKTQISLRDLNQSICQNFKFLTSKTRQKGDYFLYQISDFCTNCNPHSLNHTTTIGECLINIWYAETCKLTLFTFLKTSIGLKLGSSLYAQTDSLSMHVCMYFVCSLHVYTPTLYNIHACWLNL